MTYPLTEAQAEFAILFVHLENQAEAYRAAYPNYCGSHASEYGRRLLRKPAIRARIEQLRGGPLPPPLACEMQTDRAVALQARDGAAIVALAAVAACPAVPAAHRVTTIELLQAQLADLAAALCVSEARGVPGELQARANGAKNHAAADMVGGARGSPLGCMEPRNDGRQRGEPMCDRHEGGELR